MSTPAAKDLLAQADHMMRPRVPEELPLLTDLVVEEIEIGDTGFARPPAMPVARPQSAPVRPPAPVPAHAVAASSVGAAPRAVQSLAPHDALAATSVSSPPNTATGASAREQFNALLISRLDEMRHGVYSQVMQQLELHAAGSLQTHLRESLTTALAHIAREIADQVAEDTSAQVRDVVSRAVDAEIARLREQLSKRR